jgi:very-short-patch-repair endonuclease
VGGDEKGWAGELSHPLSYRTLRQIARELRANQTPAERRLWLQLRYGKRLGYKFRRQHVIGRFIVDFYCPEAALIIEVDGSVHRMTVNRDFGRQEYLENLGLTVLRFTNEDIFERLEKVVLQVNEALRAAADAPERGRE